MRSAHALRLAVVAGLCAACTACGTGTTAPSPAPSRTPGSGCAATTSTGAGVRLDAAALLTMMIAVDAPQAVHPRCVPGRPGQAVTLHPGDRVEFIANEPPRVDPAGSQVVRVTTAEGPASTGPGGISASHLLVTVTAQRPGMVSLTWFDCSGTGC